LLAPNARTEPDLQAYHNRLSSPSCSTAHFWPIQNMAITHAPLVSAMVIPKSFKITSTLRLPIRAFPTSNRYDRSVPLSSGTVTMPIPLHGRYVPRSRLPSHRPSLSQSRLLPRRLLPLLPKVRFRRPLLPSFIFRKGCTPGSRSPLRWPSLLPSQDRYGFLFSFAIALIFFRDAWLTLFSFRT
jgi:hypothetical protein